MSFTLILIQDYVQSLLVLLILTLQNSFLLLGKQFINQIISILSQRPMLCCFRPQKPKFLLFYHFDLSSDGWQEPF